MRPAPVSSRGRAQRRQAHRAWGPGSLGGLCRGGRLLGEHSLATVCASSQPWASGPWRLCSPRPGHSALWRHRVAGTPGTEPHLPAWLEGPAWARLLGGPGCTAQETRSVPEAPRGGTVCLTTRLTHSSSKAKKLPAAWTLASTRKRKRREVASRARVGHCLPSGLKGATGRGERAVHTPAPPDRGQAALAEWAQWDGHDHLLTYRKIPR